MGAKKVEMHRLQELVRLHRMGIRCRDVAKRLQMSPKTELQYRRILKSAGLLEGDPEDLPPLEVLRAAVEKELPTKTPRQERSTVEPWKGAIERMLKKGSGPTAIYDRLRLDDPDFDGSLSAIKRMCVRLKKEQGIASADVVLPVEMAAGEYAQVDFGYAGRLYDPGRRKERKAWFFVMVLCFSRQMFVRIVFDQQSETWLRLHVEAFREFGGVPAIVRPDNLKAAVIRGAFGVNDEELNRSYRELARHYSFQIDPTPPRSPEKKGRVESAVKYVKNNFFKPRKGEFENHYDARRQLEAWNAEIASKRVHGTTGRKPIELFEEEERAALLPLPAVPYEIVVWKKAKVHTDTHVYFDQSLYSVPWKNVGREVWVRGTPTTVAVYVNDARIATHKRLYEKGRQTVDRHLPSYRSGYRHRRRSWWEKKALGLGSEVSDYIQEVFNSDDVLSKIRTVQAIVTLLEKFPPERRAAACKRASYYMNYSYGGIKNILRKELDFEPLPEDYTSGWGQLENPRFSRSSPNLFEKGDPE